MLTKILSHKGPTALFMLWLLSHITVAQPPESLYFKHLTPHQGLSQTIVNDIMQDQFGFMWFTSYDGVSRFDGIACQSNQEIAPGAEGLTRAKGIVEDPKGNIWIGQIECLFQFNYAQNHFVKLVPNWEIHTSWKKHVVMFEPMYATETHLLVKIQVNTFIVIDLLSQDVVHLIYLHHLPDSGQFPEAIIEVLKQIHAVAYIDTKNYIFLPASERHTEASWQMVELDLSGAAVFSESVHVSADTAVFFFDFSNEIWSYNIQKRKLRSIHKPTVDRILHLHLDKQGLLWVSTNGGLIKLDVKNGSQLAFYKQESQNPETLQGRRCSFSFVSKEGILWTSVWGRGVSYASLENDGFTHHLTDNESLRLETDNFVRGIIQASNGRFYCSTNAGGIIELDETLRFTKKLFDYQSNFIYADPGGRHIYFCDQLLYRYDHVTKSLQSITQSAEQILKYRDSNHIQHISPQKNGDMLLGSMQGIWQLDKDFREIRDVPGLNERLIYETFIAYEDRHEKIYKHSYHGGLEYFELKGDKYSMLYQFPERFITYQIYEEHDSLVWIGTSSGLIRFNPLRQTIENQYTMKDGLPNNTVYAMAADSLGRIWLSTNRGIASINKADGFIRQYRDHRGVGSVEYNARVVVCARDGRIIFGGTRGLTAIEPGKIAPHTKLPDLHFSAIQTDKLINPYPFNLIDSPKLEIPAGINTIEISIAALDLMNPNAQQIKYRLRDVDEDWVVRSNPVLARYTRLPPGSYTFEALAVNEDGYHSDQPKLLQIEFAAFWWQEWWFRILAVAAIIFLIIAMVSYYTTYKLREKRWRLENEKGILSERERITADLHDDMGASLSSMHIFSDLASQSWDSQPTLSREMLNKIKLQSAELMSRMNDIVWSLKTPNGQSHSFIDKLKNSSVDLLSAKEIQVDFKYDEAVETSLNNPIMRKNMLLIAREAFNNIAKHSGASKAEVEIREVASRLEFRISDNGNGLPPTIIRKGNGLENMELRCRQMDGKFEVNLAPCSGFTITCSIPIARNSYLDSGR